MNKKVYTMVAAIVFLLLVLIGFNIFIGYQLANAGEWKPRHVNKEILWQGLNVIDTFQSIQISSDPYKYHEKGLPRMFWGQHPSSMEMAGTMAGWSVAHWWLTDIIPEKWNVFGMELHPKDFFQDFTIGVTGTTICFNWSIGLNGDFR